MAICLNNEQTSVPLDLEAWEVVCERIASALEVPEAAEWSLTFVDDEAIRALNRDYRGYDKPTDVLAFSQLEGEAIPMPEGEEAPVELGDVIVSAETALRQAEARGHGLDAELSLLITHGLLHLLGEDHDTPKKKARMWARQGAVLESLGVAVRELGDD